MQDENITYLKIPLTAEIAEKLGIAIRFGKLNNQDVVDYDFNSNNPHKVLNVTGLVNKENNKNEMLLNLRTEIKEFIIFDLGKALTEFKKRLETHSSTFDSIILLLAKFNRIGQSRHQGLIAFQEAELEFTKIENAVMYMVNNLEKDEINKTYTI